MHEIRSKYYRVSVKALVFDESGGKFLVMRQDNGVWDLPGGGLEWGEAIGDCLRREITEEMGLIVTSIESEPSYFLGGYPMVEDGSMWIVNIVYNTKLKDLDFTASDECRELRFVSIEDMESLEKVPPTVMELAEKVKSIH